MMALAHLKCKLSCPGTFEFNLGINMKQNIVEALEREIEILRKDSSRKDKLIQKLKTTAACPKHYKTRTVPEAGQCRKKGGEVPLLEKEDRLAELEHRLQEYDTTVRVLAEVWGREKSDIDARIKSTFNANVFPYIEKIKSSKSVGEIHTYIRIIEENLNEMRPVFNDAAAAADGDFTPSEINVMQLIRQGKRSKEISELLNISTKAISFHRSNIRKKLGIVNKKLNLMTFLRGQSPLR